MSHTAVGRLAWLIKIRPKVMFSLPVAFLAAWELESGHG